MLTRTALVAGGGISGLTVAYELERRGIDCLLVEKEPRLGGLIWTTHHEGHLMDGGPDAFLAAKPHARQLASELGIAGELLPTNPEERKIYVLHGGRLRPMPEGMRLTVPTRTLPLLGSSLFSPAGKMRILAERFVPRRARDEEESIASFVTRRFGEEALARVGEPLLSGIHCGDASRLSMDRLFPNLVELERRHGSVTRGIARAKGAEASVFLSFRGGMGRLVERLREEIPDGTLRAGEPLVRVRPSAGSFACELGSGETVTARIVVLALPLAGSVQVLSPTLPDVAATLARIPTVSTAVVFHAFARQDVPHPLDGYGFVVPATEPARLLAATFVSTKFSGRAPEGRALLRTFLGGRRDPDILALSDDALVRVSLQSLGAILGPLGRPSFSRVFRWDRRTPQVELGHGEILDALGARLAALPGLHILASGLGGVGIPDSIARARETARELIRRLESE